MNNIQKLLIVIVLSINFYFVFAIYKYWRADIYYNRGEYSKALEITPKEPNYIAKNSIKSGSLDEAFKAYGLNPYNQNTIKILISNLTNSASEKPDHLLIAEDVLLKTIKTSPNDPRLYYQLGILYLKMNKSDNAIRNLEKSIMLRPNYKEARFALGITFKALNENNKSKMEFEYILKNIDPNDVLTKKYLEQVISASK